MSLTVNKATEDAKNQLFLDENQNINFKYDGILTDDFKYFIINESGIYRVSNYQTYKDNSILYFHFTYGGFTVMNGYSEGFYEKGELICFAIYADNPDFISSSYEITLLKIDDNS